MIQLSYNSDPTNISISIQKNVIKCWIYFCNIVNILKINFYQFMSKYIQTFFVGPAPIIEDKMINLSLFLKSYSYNQIVRSISTL